MNCITKYCFFVLLFYSTFVSAQTQVSRPQVAVAYVNNFARYITWPDENQIVNFKIVIYSSSEDIINEFNEFSQTRKIKGKNIIVSSYHTLSDLKDAQLILLTSDKSDDLSKIYDAIEGRPILMVSENYPDKRSIMINLYETEQKQLLFEINKSNVINQGLKIDPEILLTGGTDIDVASLYRSSQTSLRSLQKDMARIKDSLAVLQENIELSTNQINIQKSELSKQTQLLEQRVKESKQYQQDLDLQEKNLEAYKDSINRKDQVLRDQELTSAKLEKSLVATQKQIEEKQKQIEKLNEDIQKKNNQMGSLSETVAQQKHTIFLFIIIGALSLFLVISFVIIFWNNKIKKDKLAVQKHEIEHQLTELQELNRKLEEADQYKSIFLASMSHELRTPLNSIIGYTGILLMGMTGELNEEQSRQLQKVKSNARHLLSLINDILDISKIEADRVELFPEEINVHELIHDIIGIILPKADEKGLTISTEVPGNLSLTTDIRRIKQVILNLVTNAVNYTDSGTVLIKAKTLPGNRINISVLDTGIGISENEMSRLFQPFQQIDSSLTKKNKGTGLGLYLCKKLMTLLGGEIFVKSESGKGSEFYIEMPTKV